MPHPDARLDAFLAAYAICGEVSSASRDVGLDRNQVYLRIKSDKAFAARFEEAKAAFVDTLKAEAVRRARDGTRKYLFHQGSPVYLTQLRLDEGGQPVRNEHGAQMLDYVTDEHGHPMQAYESAYSDRLLLAMLAANTDEYATKSDVRLTGANGGPVDIKMSDADVARRVAFVLHKGMIAAKTPDLTSDPGGDLV